MTSAPTNPQTADRHVVLVAPDIHWNTGNIGRTCVGTDACLHLIKPLGFSLDSRFVKRAGLDYWDRVNLRVWQNFTTFARTMAPPPDEVCLLTKKGAKPFWSMPKKKRLFLIFGSETRGLPDAILSKYAERAFYIPTNTNVRSLNLSTAVGIVLYESLRKFDIQHDWIGS